MRKSAVAALADRYFNEQVARLGPIAGAVHIPPEPKRKRGRPRKQKVEIIR